MFNEHVYLVVVARWPSEMYYVQLQPAVVE